MTMITPSYLGETIEYSSLHACRSTLEDPTHRAHPNRSLRLALFRPRSWRRPAALALALLRHPHVVLLLLHLLCFDIRMLVLVFVLVLVRLVIVGTRFAVAVQIFTFIVGLCQPRKQHLQRGQPFEVVGNRELQFQVQQRATVRQAASKHLQQVS